jgi:hypothetical protein
MDAIADALQTMIDHVSQSSTTRFSRADVVRLAGSLTNWDFYNAAGIQIARKYKSGEISYTVADGMMNDLWGAAIEGICTSEARHLPSPFDEIYYAFDAGEYYHTKDKSDDPVAEITDPLVTELLLKYGPSGASS